MTDSRIARRLLPLTGAILVAACAYAPLHPLAPTAPTAPTAPAAPAIPPLIGSAPPTPVLGRRTGAALAHYQGCLANYHDAEGRWIWTPALPGAPPAVVHEWLTILAAHGCTHIPIGPFTPGPAYPGIVAWDNPDWTQDPTAIRGLLNTLLTADAGDGLGFTPVIFGYSGGGDGHLALETLRDQALATIAAAIVGLEPDVIVVPDGWEPLPGIYTSRQASDGLLYWATLAPSVLVGWHCGVTTANAPRCVLASNPLEPDDPWQGDEAGSYTSHGGDTIGLVLYQTPHGAALYRDCDEDDDSGACLWNRFQDYVSRIGAGYHGWRVMPFVLFETCAYDVTHDPTRDPAVACPQVATIATRIATKWGVTLGQGNGVVGR